MGGERGNRGEGQEGVQGSCASHSLPLAPPRDLLHTFSNVLPDQSTRRALLLETVQRQGQWGERGEEERQAVGGCALVTLKVWRESA